MKKLRMDAYLRGTLTIAIGFLMSFFGDLISLLFYVAGGGIILYSIIIMILGIYRHKESFEVPKAIIGILIGLGIVILPQLLKVGIPLFVGIIMLFGGIKGVLGTVRLGKKENKLWIAVAVVSGMLIIAGLYFIFNPEDVSEIMTIIVGFILIFSGVITIFKELFRKKKKVDIPNDGPVIDLKNYSVSDDD